MKGPAGGGAGAQGLPGFEGPVGGGAPAWAGGGGSMRRRGGVDVNVLKVRGLCKCVCVSARAGRGGLAACLPNECVCAAQEARRKGRTMQPMKPRLYLIVLHGNILHASKALSPTQPRLPAAMQLHRPCVPINGTHTFTQQALTPPQSCCLCLHPCCSQNCS